MDDILSPTLRQLMRDMLISNKALDAFWDSLVSSGAPLIEPLEGDSGHSLVTFLWRDTEGSNIVVYGEFPGFEDSANKLERLASSDLLFKSFVAPNHVWSLYVYRVEEPRTGKITYHTDPFNPKQYHAPIDEIKGCPFLAPMESILKLPGVIGLPWSPNPQLYGALDLSCTIEDASQATQRRVWVHTPPGYDFTKQYPVLVLTDGWEYIHVGLLPQRMEQAIEIGRIPPLVTVYIDSCDYTAREKELTCNPQFASFIARELIPWVRKGYSIAPEPTQCIIAGASYGGLAAAYIGLTQPETFGRVICQSGAFYWHPEGESQRDWLIAEYKSAPHRELSFCLEVGTLEPAILTEATHRMHEVLAERGYQVHCAYTNGGHHYIYWAETLVASIEKLVLKV